MHVVPPQRCGCVGCRGEGVYRDPVTGCWYCFGCRPVPSLKLATNTPLYRRMAEDMDINCGEILDGTTDLATMGERIFRAMLEAASGRPTKSEQLGHGEDEFAPWHLNPWF